ncbi:MAG: hypothetical protein N2606_01840, partial [Candidatus Omnitrophica bacterium]|nr:hypothetical protein [Candidatus Omnitrophota bacterium]
MVLNMYSLPALFSVVANIGIGTIVLFKNPKKFLNKIFFTYCLILSTWVLGCFGESVVHVPQEALFWDKIIYLGCIFTPVVYIHFLFYFLGRKPKKFELPLSYGTAIFFQLFNFIPSLRRFFVIDVIRKYHFRFIGVPNVVWYIFFIWFNFYVVYGFYLIFTSYKKAKGLERNKIRYLLLAYMVMITSGSLYFLLVFNISTLPIDPFLLVVYCSLMAHIIIKYRLMDVRVAITRTGLFLFVYAIVLGIPFGVTPFFKGVLEGWLGSNWWIVPMAVMGILATGGPYVYIGLQRKAEERLLKEQRRYQGTLKQAAVGMTRIRQLRKLL